MKIEHIAILYQDLERAKRFFEDYFGAAAGKPYRNEKTGFSSYFLTFEDGCRLEIMNRPNVKASNEKDGFGLSHIAFSAGGRQAVDELTERLRNGGYTVKGEPRVTGDGYYESVIADFEGNTIEITA
ncbi:MAG: VOC family protein [Ruminococcus sp.]|nr:VOC family protein [Ruminococcus sp.]MCM1480207.1 VOC family protein [Muribaculaceae bacterium]